MISSTRVVILGDSLSEGLGSLKINYVDDLAKNLSKRIKSSIEVINLSKTGTTISYPLQHLEKIFSLKPEIVVCFYGSVDGIIRPDYRKSRLVTTILPRRYKLTGMLDPRPYYSSSLYRSFFEHIDSIIRVTLKLLLLKTFGGYVMTSISDFEHTYNRLADEIVKLNSIVVLVSTVRVEERYFPGSNHSLQNYDTVIKRIAEQRGFCFCNLREAQNRFNLFEITSDDLFHPNKEGNSLIASEIVEAIWSKK